MTNQEIYDLYKQGKLKNEDLYKATDYLSYFVKYYNKIAEKDINKFVSNELLPEINNYVKNYMDDKFSYIETPDDLEDLEYAEVEEDLINETKQILNNLITDNSSEYDFTDVKKDLNEDLLYTIVESAFIDYKEMLIEKFNEEFDRRDFFDDYYSNEEDNLF